MENKWFTVVMIFLSLFFIAMISLASPVQKEDIIINSTASTNLVTFNETQTNASQSIWNHTFWREGNQTFYITLPQNVTVTSATMNFTGFKWFNIQYTGTHWDTSGQMDYTHGITTDNNNIWISTASDKTIYKYNMDGTYTETSWSVSNCVDVNALGMCNNGTHMWVVDQTYTSDDHLCRYTINGNYDNWKIDLIDYNNNPSACWANQSGSEIRVSEPANDGIVYYNYTGSFDDGTVWAWTSDYGYVLAGPTGMDVVTFEGFDYMLAKGYAFPSANPYYFGIYNNTYLNLTPYWRRFYPLFKDHYNLESVTDPVCDGDCDHFTTNGTHMWLTHTTEDELDIGNDSTQDWNYTGQFSVENRTNDLSTAINNYLSTCTPDANGNCNVPFVLNSIQSKIQVSAINITYTYNASMLFTEDSNSNNYYWNQTSGIVAGSQYIKHFRVTNTSNKAQNNISVLGYYLKNQTATKCYINGTEYTPTGTPKYCPFSFTITQGTNWINHNISDKPKTIAVTISESSYTQDTSKQSEAGANKDAYITSTITLTNPSDTGETLSGTYSQPARSGWACDSGCSGSFSLSDDGSVENVTNQSKLNVITKTEVETVMDIDFTTVIIADTSINSVDFYYWNTTLELNNTDNPLNYTNVRWYNYLQGANFGYEQNISGGNISQLNYSDPINVTSRFRTGAVTTEEEVTDTGTAYEKDITVTCPDSVDSAFVSNYYINVLVNVTTSTEYTNYNFYWWNGVAWEKHTETEWYNFTTADDYSWGSFKTNCSVNYYAISSETPEYQPPGESPPGGAGGAEPIIKIVSGNWSIIQPNFYLLAAPGSEVVSYITIDNRMNTEIEYVDLTCVPSTCKPNDPCSCVDLCPYVTFGEKLVQIKGKPFFQVYQIPPGQSGKAPFYINFTSAYAQDHNLPEIQSCFYSFSIKVTIGEVSNPVNVQVIALPGMEQIGRALTWLERKTLIIPGKYPVYIDNWLLLVIAIIVVILLFVGIVKILR